MPPAPAQGHDTAETPLSAPRSLGELFRVFNRLALQGFGGVLPVTQHHLVERERWMSRQDFVETLATAQVLPGPNVVNLALMVGDRHFGWRGAVVALAGMLVTPTLIVLLMTALYLGFADQPQVAGALRGMAAASAGLVLATGWKMLSTLKRHPLGLRMAVALAAVGFSLVAVLRLPLVVAVLGLGGASSLLVAWRLSRPPAA